MLRIVMALLCLLMVHSHAFAGGESGVYLAPRAVIAVLQTDAEAAFLGRQWGPKRIYAARAGGGVALGYDFQPRHGVPLRAELEYAAFDHVSKQGRARILRRPMEFRAKLGVQTMLASVSVDIFAGKSFSPFLSVGAGGAWIESRGESPLGRLEESSLVFAGQAGGGCSYAVAPGVAVEVGYRFLMMGSVSDSSPQMAISFRKGRMHQAWLGMRLTF